MKKPFLLILITFFILTSCSNLKESDNAGIAQQNVNSGLFEKKEACSKYQDGITEKLTSKYFYVEETRYEGYFELEKVFYSPKADSCLYIAKESDYKDGKLDSESFTLVDALTGELISASLRPRNDPTFSLNQEALFNDIVNEYK